MPNSTFGSLFKVNCNMESEIILTSILSSLALKSIGLSSTFNGYFTFWRIIIKEVPNVM